MRVSCDAEDILESKLVAYLPRVPEIHSEKKENRLMRGTSFPVAGIDGWVLSVV